MGLWEKFDNVQVKGDLEVKGNIVGPKVPKIATGSYVGNGQANQAIASAFVVKHIDVLRPLQGADGEEGAKYQKNDAMQIGLGGQQQTIGIHGTQGAPGLMDYVDAIDLLTPATGFRVKGALNIQGIVYFYTIWG